MGALLKIRLYILMLLALIVMLLLNNPSSAQEGYISNDNYIGIWEDAASWNASVNWLPNTPDRNVGGGVSYVNVKGYITTSGDLVIAGSSVLNVFDTLWVTGNLDITGGGRMNVMTDGVLVVTGDFEVDGGTISATSGRVVVMGDVSAKGGSEIINTPNLGNAFYVYGTISQSGGATFNGSKNTNNGNFENQSQLYSNDIPLANFVGSVLPIELLWTKATQIQNSVKIEWATASEINNEVFVVEKSLDGIHFENIGEVAGAGNSNLEISYSYYDDTYNASGVAYYRLKQIDFNGQFEYSDVFTAKRTGNSGISEAGKVSVFPNPATERIFVHISQDVFSIQLYGVNGTMYINKVYNDQDQSTRELDISSLASGTYFLRIENGGDPEVIEIIKQ